MDRFDCISLSKEESEDTKGKSEYVNRGTDNTMAKRKRTKEQTTTYIIQELVFFQTSSKPALQVFHLRGAWHPPHTLSVFHLRGEWHPPHTLFTMINDQAFHIITWHTTIEDHTPYPPPQQILGSSVDQALTTIMNPQQKGKRVNECLLLNAIYTSNEVTKT